MFESESKYLLCRLCKSTKFLHNLYEIKEDTSFVEKTNQCLGLEIHQNDGLPSMICKFCKRVIERFYIFKQNCLKVNSELNIIKGLVTSIKVEDDIQPKTDRLEYDSLDICSSEENINRIENRIQQVHNKYSEENIRSDISDEEHVFDSTVENCVDINKDKHSPSSIQCELCGNIYKSKTEFKTHSASHSEARLYQCQFCSKHFTRVESREVHIRAHLGIRPFICEICGKSSTKKQDLIRHLKIHSDERNFECLTCGRKFKRSADLHTHRRTHTGARPYKCKNCGKAYTSNSGLRKHIQSKICKELDNYKNLNVISKVT